MTVGLSTGVGVFVGVAVGAPVLVEVTVGVSVGVIGSVQVPSKTTKSNSTFPHSKTAPAQLVLAGFESETLIRGMHSPLAQSSPSAAPQRLISIGVGESI